MRIDFARIAVLALFLLSGTFAFAREGDWVLRGLPSYFVTASGETSVTEFLPPPIGQETFSQGIDGAAGLPKSEIRQLITEMEKQMKSAAQDLEFEKAAVLRDQIFELRSILAEESNLPPWEKVKLLAGEE